MSEEMKLKFANKILDDCPLILDEYIETTKVLAKKIGMPFTLEDNDAKAFARKLVLRFISEGKIKPEQLLEFGINLYQKKGKQEA